MLPDTFFLLKTTRCWVQTSSLTLNLFRRATNFCLKFGCWTTENRQREEKWDAGETACSFLWSNCERYQILHFALLCYYVSLTRRLRCCWVLNLTQQTFQWDNWCSTAGHESATHSLTGVFLEIRSSDWSSPASERLFGFSCATFLSFRGHHHHHHICPKKRDEMS